MPVARLKRLLFGAPVAPAPKLPPGLRIYAIGDIHGRSDLLDQLAGAVESDMATARVESALAVFLGDYVDRGLDSAGVVERLVSGAFPVPIKALRGNHEATLLGFLEDANVLDSWRRFGGLECLHSYGVGVASALRGQGYAEAQSELRARIPRDHLRFLASTVMSAVYGDYFFCHAGVRPNVPLERQTENDLLWIRDEFLGFKGWFGKVVVHGHTPVDAPEMTANRINVDTGAYATSVLTALVLEGADRRFIDTRRV